MAGFEKTEAGAHLSKIMKEGYMDLHQRAAEGAFVVWVAIIVPVEIFAGFDNVVFAVPESHAATSAAKGVGVLQCEKAESRGYSQDLCSYARIDIGTAMDGGRDSPTFGLPKPDLLVSDNNNCSLLVKWFDVYHREWNVPHFVLDVPFCYGNQSERDLEYILAQFHDLIECVERLSGQKFDMDKARQAVEYTAEGVSHWKRFLRFAGHRPAGITVFDSFVQMAPFLTLRGTPQFAEHYKILATETARRVNSGTYPLPNEKYRLMWDNIAPWHQLRKMAQRLGELGANIVAAPYTSCIGSVEGSWREYQYDGDPLRYLARGQNNSVCPHGLVLRSQAMSEAINEIGIDGVVFASNRSCKVFSVMQMDQQRLIARRHDIPTCMIDVDHADARKYSEESAFLRLEALLEQIEAKRAA
ncbi:MAG: 2-hydroxyacyl-CoA dehydratase subunit D [Desulfatibacillaceae bacterium]